MSLHPLLAENSLFEFIGKIFHPIFEAFGWVLAALYGVWPNYGFAITGLTILIMLALTPVTVKSTKSMIAMQRLQPEMKKLQAKYKGAENRELLNQEMMKLYKENGTSPFGACLPSLLQMPFLIVLYSLIRGLSSTVTRGATYVNAAGQTAICKAQTCGAPKYIPTSSQMHQSLVLSKGQMHWWFGMDLSSYPFSHHTYPGSPSQAVLMLPYLALIGAAMFLQYFQMKQMNSRNPQAAAANPQMQTMQKFFPIIFGVIYLRVPAGATIYMVVSSAMRIGTQEVMFRTGMVKPVAAEREIAASKGSDAAALESPKSKPKQTPKPAPKATKKVSTATDGTSVAGSTVPPAKRPTSNGRSGGGGAPANGKSPGGASGGSAPPDDAAAAAKTQNRSRSKKTRKDR